MLQQLSAEIADRVVSAGVAVIESRLTRLAYAPEIAQAMLRRQQAEAVVAARQRIVDGAVGMVHLALDRLAEEAVVELDEERKATMVFQSARRAVQRAGDTAGSQYGNTLPMSITLHPMSITLPVSIGKGTWSNARRFC